MSLSICIVHVIHVSRNHVTASNHHNYVCTYGSYGHESISILRPPLGSTLICGKCLHVYSNYITGEYYEYMSIASYTYLIYLLQVCVSPNVVYCVCKLHS